MVLMFLAAAAAFMQYLYNKADQSYPAQTVSTVKRVRQSLAVVASVGVVLDALQMIQRAITPAGVAGGTRYFGATVASDAT